MTSEWTLSAFNDDQSGEIDSLLASICGAKKFRQTIAAQRPFANLDTLGTAMDHSFRELSESDWLEAFTHHPKIGDVEDLRRRFPSSAAHSQSEQAGVASSGQDVLERLAAGNKAYEKKFGFIFIVCASGKSAEEMLELLEDRLGSSRATELQVAAGEQQKISHLRLRKLIHE